MYLINFPLLFYNFNFFEVLNLCPLPHEWRLQPCSGYSGDRVSLFGQGSLDHDPPPILWFLLLLGWQAHATMANSVSFLILKTWPSFPWHNSKLQIPASCRISSMFTLLFLLVTKTWFERILNWKKNILPEYNNSHSTLFAVTLSKKPKTSASRREKKDIKERSMA